MSNSRAEDAISETQKTRIENQFGPILLREQAPFLYDVVGELFDELSQAQLRILNSERLIVNDVVIVQSPKENAFVSTESRPGIQKTHNTILITTASLAKAFEVSQITAASSEAEIEGSLLRGILRIVGMLSHELAHPKDSLDSFSLNAIYGYRGKQAVELRADIDATDIAIEAGYPAETVYLDWPYSVSF
jgi:hypothetical protein